MAFVIPNATPHPHALATNVDSGSAEVGIRHPELLRHIRTHLLRMWIRGLYKLAAGPCTRSAASSGSVEGLHVSWLPVPGTRSAASSGLSKGRVKLPSVIPGPDPESVEHKTLFHASQRFPA